jgi:hypothetical protein
MSICRPFALQQQTFDSRSPDRQQPIKSLVAALETIRIDYSPPYSVVPGGSRVSGIHLWDTHDATKGSREL